MKDLIQEEVGVLNRLLRNNNLLAKIVKAENVLDSLVRYQMILHTTQSFSAVEKLLRELTVAANRVRHKYNAPNTDILPVSKPFFALELMHPDPKPLLWSIRKSTTLESHKMLLGVSTVDKKAEIIDLEKTPHTLIAGITGAGKSILLQMMLLSLSYATDPSELELILIDLKNEDLAPLCNLPHTKFFAGSKDKARQAILDLITEKDRRIENSSKTDKRIILVIDELAQVADDKIIQKSLKDLISIGRSKRINIIVATQSVTKDGGLGSMLKSNFTCRLIGKVAPSLSAIATGLPNQYAHFLPGNGSFLRLEGSVNHRFQSYFIEDQDVKLLSNEIIKKYRGGAEFYNTGVSTSATRVKTEKQEIKSSTGVKFPIGLLRELTEEEFKEVIRLSKLPEYQHLGKPSINKLVMKVFGFKNIDTLTEIKVALEGSF